jgi:sensor histidine kinase YesM
MNTKNKWFWISPIIFGTLVLVIIRLVSDVPNEAKFWERPPADNIIEFVAIIIISFAIECILQRFVKQRNNNTEELSVKQLVKEYFIVMSSGILFTIPCLYAIHFFTGDPVGIDDLVIAEIVTTLLIIIYYSIFRGSNLLRAYVNQKTLTQQMKNTQMETELKFLKAQFHPHFLFNALNAIYFQIDENNEAPRKSIEQLSELLRYQLYDINQAVHIKQELNFIRNYIEFQNVRMKGSFRLTVDIAPNLNEQQIQPLLLFPLVENSYKYVGGEYWISIKACLQNDGLCFSVENAISKIPQAKSKNASGIGLENLQKRLNLLYPKKHIFETTQTDNSFTAKLQIEW